MGAGGGGSSHVQNPVMVVLGQWLETKSGQREENGGNDAMGSIGLCWLSPSLVKNFDHCAPRKSIKTSAGRGLVKKP